MIPALRISLLLLGSLAAAALVATTRAHSAPTAGAPLAHVRSVFQFDVAAPYKAAFPLFGPDGERAWAGKEWNPQFLHPSPAADMQGAVFTVRHGDHETVWVNTAFDLAGRHIQYVYFVPGIIVTTIDLHFSELSASATHVTVTYERTALTPAANDTVHRLSLSDRDSGRQWQEAIDGYLSSAAKRRAGHS